MMPGPNKGSFLRKVSNISTGESLKDTLIPSRNVLDVGDRSLMKTEGSTKLLDLDQKISQAAQFLREFYIENLR